MIPAMTGAVLAAGGNSLAASVVAKVTLTTALGLAAARLARRNRAALRHALLVATFGVIPVLPIASILAPPIRVAVPIIVRSRATLPPPEDSIDALPSGSPTDAGVRTTPAISQTWRFSLSDLLLGGWIAGTALFLIQLAIGLGQVRSLRRSGSPWRHGQSVAQTLALDAGIHRRIEVLLHEAVPGPMTCGVMHPAIVLPQDAEGWESEDLNRAMIHELEHVRRGDSVSRCFARAACAVYWFHPLVWIAWRKLVLEAERSCDDAVLRRSEATAYADQLVGLARRLSISRRPPIVAMANRADLAARVGAVLDSRQKRGQAGALSLGIACATAVALVIAMSPLVVVASPQAEPRPTFEVASVKPIDRATMHRDHEGRQLDGGRFVDRTDLVQFIVMAYISVTGRGCIVKAALGEDCPMIAGQLPAWAKTDRFEIQAKVPANSLPGYTARQLRDGDTPELSLMLQALLEDRFHLKVHQEMREIPVYALTVGKNAAKLKQTPPKGELMKTAGGSLVERHGLQGMQSVPTQDGTTRMRLNFQASSMQDAVDALERYFDRPVLERTGLKGDYDFAIEYEVDQNRPGPATAGNTSGLGGNFFNPFTGLTSSALSVALQDVGLKLESTKAPVEVLVIDHVEKPSGN